MSQPLQTRLKLLYTRAGKDVIVKDDFFQTEHTEKGADITESILPDLLSFTYDDKESGEADEISITLKDNTGKWAGTWKPNGGEHIRAFILPGDVDKAKKTLPCGKFFVDDLSTSGGSSGRTFTMKAVSIPLDKVCRRKVKSQSWNRSYLKDIAEKIAKESGMSLLWDSDENPKYDRLTQKRESDLKFLSRLCEDAGLSIKVTDGKIVIFSQKKYESEKPVMTVTPGMSDIMEWNFESAQSETYKSCTVEWTSVLDHSSMKYTFYDPDVDDNGQEYNMKLGVVSYVDAGRRAEKKLRELNSRKVTGSMTLIGNILLSAGSVIACKGFGSFDGKFIIEKASHSISSSGYTTAIDLRRVNSNY